MIFPLKTWVICLLGVVVDDAGSNMMTFTRVFDGLVTRVDE